MNGGITMNFTPMNHSGKHPVFLWYFAPNHWNYKNFSLIESFYEESTTPKYYKTCKTLKGFIMQSQKIFDIQLLMIFAFFLSDRAFITCKKIGSKSKVSQKTFICYLSFATKIVMLPFLINEKRLNNIRQFSWITRYCNFFNVSTMLSLRLWGGDGCHSQRFERPGDE